jgi:beta-glucanase (GH16 family)
MGANSSTMTTRIVLLLMCWVGAVAASATESPQPALDLPLARCRASAEAFHDELNGHDGERWQMSDGWANGAPFWCGWRADHVEFGDGIMSLRLDDVPCDGSPYPECSGQPYGSAEYWTSELLPYGRVEARLRAAAGDGLVTSLFTYTGPSDNGNPHDEIDIEIIGKDTTRVELNYYASGVTPDPPITPVELGFDAAAGFHTYAFEWSAEAITWYVDGTLVYTETAARATLPSTPGHIMVNLWCGTGVDGWLGPFVYLGSPIYADYDWIRYEPAGTLFFDGFEGGGSAAWSASAP